MTALFDTSGQQSMLAGIFPGKVAVGLILAFGGLMLGGCDKVQIPGIGGPAAAPAAPAPVAASPAPAAQPAPQQPTLAPPTTMELPKKDGKTAVKSFLEKAKGVGNIEDADLLTVSEVTEGLEAVEKLELPGAKVTDKGIAVLSKFPRLTSVNITSTQVTNEGIKVFASMPLLEELALSGTKVTDVGVASISDHPSLKSVRLANTAITDESLAMLDKMANLEVLDISYTPVTGAGFEKFRGNKKLRVLYAQHSGIQPGAFKFLKGAPIEDLNVDVTGTNDLAMLSIGTFKKLKNLKMEFCGGITDFGMAKLTGLKDLETLSVRNVESLTSRSLLPLKSCKKLKSLNIVGTRIPQSEAMGFRKIIGPGLKIDL